MLRGTNSSAALVVLGIALLLWGIYQVVKRSTDKKKALNNPVLQDPRVIEFYNNTLNSWQSGKLDYLNTTFRQNSKCDYDSFVAALPPAPGSALAVFFEQFPPLPGEYLVGVGNDSSGKAWFVLTNLRLMQKDGSANVFKVIYLNNIQEYLTAGKMTKELTFVMKNGERVIFEKVGRYPGEEYVKKMIAQGFETQQEQIQG